MIDGSLPTAADPFFLDEMVKRCDEERDELLVNVVRLLQQKAEAGDQFSFGEICSGIRL